MLKVLIYVSRLIESILNVLFSTFYSCSAKKDGFNFVDTFSDKNNFRKTHFNAIYHFIKRQSLLET